MLSTFGLDSTLVVKNRAAVSSLLVIQVMGPPSNSSPPTVTDEIVPEDPPVISKVAVADTVAPAITVLVLSAPTPILPKAVRLHAASTL